MADLVILGAGPAGLGAAYRVARAGHRVVVCEREQGPGGAAASFTIGGMRVDVGSHRLHPSTHPAVLAELRRLLGDDLQLRQRNGRLRLRDRWLRFPLRAGDLLRRLPPGVALRAARDILTAPARRPAGDSFAAVLRARLGATLCEEFYFPYARKLWGVEPDELSGEQARRRVSADSPARLLRRVFAGAASPRRVFYYPRRGFGAISEALAAAAADAGAVLRFGEAAVAVELANDGVAVRLAGGEVVEADRVWSTIPLPVLARLAHPAPPAPTLAAAASLRTRALLLVYLVLDTDRYTSYDAHYLPTPITPVSRLSEPKNYRDGDDPAGRSVLCAEVPCDRDDPLWRADAETLGEMVTDGLAAVGLPRPTPVDVVVRRLPAAYPVYQRGYEEAFEAVDRWASDQPRLLTFGRQGLFAHDNSHHALAMAWAAADALGETSFDAPGWAAARARFATHVVED